MWPLLLRRFSYLDVYIAIRLLRVPDIRYYSIWHWVARSDTGWGKVSHDGWTVALWTVAQYHRGTNWQLLLVETTELSVCSMPPPQHVVSAVQTWLANVLAGYLWVTTHESNSSFNRGTLRPSTYLDDYVSPRSQLHTTGTFCINTRFCSQRLAIMIELVYRWSNTVVDSPFRWNTFTSQPHDTRFYICSKLYFNRSCNCSWLMYRSFPKRPSLADTIAVNIVALSTRLGVLRNSTTCANKLQNPCLVHLHSSFQRSVTLSLQCFDDSDILLFLVRFQNSLMFSLIMHWNKNPTICPFISFRGAKRNRERTTDETLTSRKRHQQAQLHSTRVRFPINTNGNLYQLDTHTVCCAIFRLIQNGHKLRRTFLAKAPTISVTSLILIEILLGCTCVCFHQQQYSKPRTSTYPKRSCWMDATKW